ncbi:MAG TPA: LysM peptidoglycan-binding domain-containing protein [Candidatus Saccharimonadales bacterium]|nr:LysM peptidoglycan-binding domain-containing protein [Candidatus Saccharimonadales bacterium]
MALLQNRQKAKLYRRLFDKLTRKNTKRRLVRYGLLAFYVVLLGATAAFVFRSSHSSASQTPADKKAASIASLTAAATSDTPANPLDQLSSVDIALQVAQMDHLPEVTPVRNQADSQQAILAMMSASSDVAAKQQVVATAFKSNKDIKTYVVKAGDTISSIAAKFHITSDSVRWSNGLGGESVTVGTKLYIPPVDGIVYTVKSGDTIGGLAQSYKARKDQIIAYNDAELAGIHPGERIIIPNGQIQQVTTYNPYAYATVGFSPTYGSDGYDYGWCTWYVATRVKMPSNWGNANTWAYYARLSGWTVSSRPVVGAIAQTPAGWAGHVAYVEAVSPDGTQIKYSDMAGLAGWGRVGYSGWVPASTYPNYIYH